MNKGIELKDKINKDQFKNTQKPGVPSLSGSSESPDLLVTWSFSIVLALVFALWAYIQIQWSKYGPENIVPAMPILPKLSEVRQNIQLMFHGYTSGYLRTILGYGIFAMISAFFLSVGSLVLGLIFKTKDGEESPLRQISFLEKASLSYILGSLVASLLWLGLGSLGFLNVPLALGLCAGGTVLFLIQCIQYKALTLLKEKLISWENRFTLTEKGLSLFLLVLLLI